MTHSNTATQPHSMNSSCNFIQTVNRAILTTFKQAQCQTTRERVRAWLFPGYRTSYKLDYYSKLTVPYLGQKI